jgi:hypothetical protein
MTQSPADEYEKPIRVGGEARERPDSKSVLRRTFDRARRGLDRCLCALGRLVGTDRSRIRSPDRSDDSDHFGLGGRSGDSDRHDRRSDRSSATVSHVAVNTDGTANDADAQLPERDQVFTRPPGDAVDDNPPEPVARVEGEKLTVELPDRPDASITSDVWERVER